MQFLRNLGIVFAILAITLVGTTSAFSAVTLTQVSTAFSNPVGIDHHEPTNKVVLSVNYPSGIPSNLELVANDGTHSQFSTLSGLTDELKIATAKNDGGGMSLGGFPSGTAFTGSGVAGVIVRISPDGLTVQNPWVTLPGEPGLMRGSLYVDRTGVFGGDLIVVTTAGNVWRVTSAGVPTPLASVGTHLEGLCVIPNDVVQYGPWAGKILAGAEGQGRLYTVDPAGTVAFYALGIQPEDIDLIPANENFFGVDYSGQKLWGAPASEFAGMAGDICIAQESPGILYRVWWDGAQFQKENLVQVAQWEHVTFSTAGIVEIPPVDPNPPVVICPNDTTLECSDPDGVIFDYTVTVSTAPPESTVGGPIVLMGIDAEDNNTAGGHGGPAPYASVLSSINSEVQNGGSGMLVIGGGKTATDDVTVFFNAIGASAGMSVTFANGASISTVSFDGYAVIAIASAVDQTNSGGLTDAENSALAGRADDIADFINTGGGLFGLSQAGLATPYGYLGDVGAFAFAFPPQYGDITATAEGLAIGITNTNLDVCCWHDEYTSWPSFLDVLATNPLTGNAAAIGGANIVVPPANMPILVCTPPPGSLFPVGTTEVCCVATDTATGLADTCCFNVTVEPGVGNIEGCVTADCTPQNLYGVTVSVFDSNGDLVALSVTGSNGCYAIEELEAGDYNVVLETPLGYTAEEEEWLVTLGCGETVNVSFSTECLAIDPEQRTIGFWKTDFGKVCGSQPGTAHYTAEELCGFLDLIAGHFNSNAVNEVAIYVPPVSDLCADKILVAKNLLNLQGSSTMLARAKQQLMALLLNVASGKIHQMTIISADGATVSQAITYCDGLIDNLASTTADHEKAKTIADKINNSQLVPAGMIPLSTANIAYKSVVPTSFALDQNYPNPFNAGTVIPYRVTENGSVKLEVFDVLGHKINTLFDGYQSAGTYQASWNGQNQSGQPAASGMYFYRLTTKGAVETKKMTLLK